VQCCRIQILPCFLHQSSVADPERDPVVPSIPIGCSEFLASSVADPDPSDRYGFGSPGSGSRSISQRNGSGSGFFYHQAKMVRKTLIPTALRLLFDFLSSKNDVNVPLKVISKKTIFKISFWLAS
jgi:hypothetical protein